MTRSVASIIVFALCMDACVQDLAAKSMDNVADKAKSTDDVADKVRSKFLNRMLKPHLVWPVDLSDITLASMQSIRSNMVPNSIHSGTVRFFRPNQVLFKRPAALFKRPAARHFHAKWRASASRRWEEDGPINYWIQSAAVWKQITASKTSDQFTGKAEGEQWAATAEQARAAADAMKKEVMSVAEPLSSSTEWEERTESSKLFKVATAWSTAEEAWAVRELRELKVEGLERAAAEMGTRRALQATAAAAQALSQNTGNENDAAAGWRAVAQTWNQAAADLESGAAPDSMEAARASYFAREAEIAARTDVNELELPIVGKVPLPIPKGIFFLLTWILFVVTVIGNLVQFVK